MGGSRNVDVGNEAVPEDQRSSPSASHNVAFHSPQGCKYQWWDWGAVFNFILPWNVWVWSFGVCFFDWASHAASGEIHLPSTCVNQITSGNMDRRYLAAIQRRTS